MAYIRHDPYLAPKRPTSEAKRRNFVISGLYPTSVLRMAPIHVATLTVQIELELGSGRRVWKEGLEGGSNYGNPETSDSFNNGCVCFEQK